MQTVTYSASGRVTKPGDPAAFVDWDNWVASRVTERICRHDRDDEGFRADHSASWPGGDEGPGNLLSLCPYGTCWRRPPAQRTVQRRVTRDKGGCTLEAAQLSGPRSQAQPRNAAAGWTHTQRARSCATLSSPARQPGCVPWSPGTPSPAGKVSSPPPRPRCRMTGRCVMREAGSITSVAMPGWLEADATTIAPSIGSRVAAPWPTFRSTPKTCRAKLR